MEIIKHQIDAGNISLAKMNPNTNQPQQIQYADLQRQRNNKVKMAQLYKRVKELNWDQKYEWVTVRRLRANTLYKSEQVQAAMELYLESLIGVDVQSSPTAEQATRVLFQLKYPILLNICSCMYKIKQYKQGVQICQKILTEQTGKDYTMAVYKKGMCLIGLGDYQQARICLKKLIEGFNIAKSTTIPKPFPLSRTDIQKMAQLLKSKQQSQQQVFQRIFEGQGQKEEENAQLYQSNSEGKQQQGQVLIYNEPILDRVRTFCKQLLQDCMGTILYYKYE